MPIVLGAPTTLGNRGSWLRERKRPSEREKERQRERDTETRAARCAGAEDAATPSAAPRLVTEKEKFERGCVCACERKCVCVCVCVCVCE